MRGESSLLKSARKIKMRKKGICCYREQDLASVSVCVCVRACKCVCVCVNGRLLAALCVCISG